MESIESLLTAIRQKLGMIAETGGLGEEVAIIGALRKSSWDDGIDIYEGKFTIVLRGDAYVLHLPLGQKFVEVVVKSTEDAINEIKIHYEKYFADFL